MAKFFYSQQDYSAAIAAKVYTKPQVKAAFIGVPTVGKRCTVIPFNHPAAYLNGCTTYTSTVLSIDDETGGFETHNTIYVKCTSLDDIEACAL